MAFTNNLEKDFIGSLKALMVRYGIDLEKGFDSSDDGEVETKWIFGNNAGMRENEIYITMEGIHNELVKMESK